MKIAGGLPSSFMGSESFGRNSPGTGTRNRSSATDFCSSLDIPDSLEKDFLHHLPFVGSDTSVGCENELQAAVAGNRSSVDLPKKITDSIFYARLNEELPASIQTRQTLSGIQEFLEDNNSGVWENSWVLLPLEKLRPGTMRALSKDFSKDTNNPGRAFRDDMESFLSTDSLGRQAIRVPVSYLLKLSLIQFLDEFPDATAAFSEEIDSLFEIFTNDNCSPEIISAYVSRLDNSTRGLCAVGDESSRRTLLMDLLLQFATHSFGLQESGQRPLIYSSPQTPYRQSRLTGFLPDNLYRQLFVNPSLSGPWESEAKHRYMELCHEVLSRSRLNAIRVTQHAGLIKNNLIVLPNIATSSLSTNGTHISIGSRILGQAANSSGRYDQQAEKYFGDLVGKVFEHFLPLFVGLYSAAPWRYGFADFHPETALQYLPHQLTSEYLGIFWQQWTKKARLKFFGKLMTPVGPKRMDSALASVLGLHGDYVPDTRLLEYFVALPSTRNASALNGMIGNDDALKAELAQSGVFDSRLSTYLPFKLREFAKHGFSGFEGRSHSHFPSLRHDLPSAIGLQTLITAYAYYNLAKNLVTHSDIPDDPATESERRHIFFAAAAGIATVYVRRSSPNRFLRRILNRCTTVRSSRRYSGYLKVSLKDYRNALLVLLRADVPDLVEAMGYESILLDLENRINLPEEYSAENIFTRSVLAQTGDRSPFALSSGEFNLAVESFYRGQLHTHQLNEGLEVLQGDTNSHQAEIGKLLNSNVNGRSPTFWINEARKAKNASLWPEPVIESLLTVTLRATCLAMRIKGE